MKLDLRRRSASRRSRNENLNRSVEELELSVRSYNCLKNANIQTIGELVQKTEAEMLKTKNFGRKSLNEIKEILRRWVSSLGMKIDEHGNAVPDRTPNRSAAGRRPTATRSVRSLRLSSYLAFSRKR